MKKTLLMTVGAAVLSSVVVIGLQKALTVAAEKECTDEVERTRKIQSPL